MERQIQVSKVWYFWQCQYSSATELELDTHPPSGAHETQMNLPLSSPASRWQVCVRFKSKFSGKSALSLDVGGTKTSLLISPRRNCSSLILSILMANRKVTKLPYLFSQAAWMCSIVKHREDVVQSSNLQGELLTWARNTGCVRIRNAGIDELVKAT